MEIKGVKILEISEGLQIKTPK